MARKALESDEIITVNPDEIPLNGQFEDVTDIQNDIDDQLNKVFMEFGGDDRDTEFKINVRRIIPGRGEQEHCFSCLPNELPITDRIAEHYGAGAYEIWIYKDGKIFKRRKLNIAKPIKKPVSINQGNESNTLEGMVNAMMQSQQQQFDQMKELFTHNQQTNAPASDPMAMMAGMMGCMVQMKDFVGGGAKQPDQFDTFLRAADFMKDMNGGGNDRSMGDMVVELAKEFGPPLMQLSKMQATKPVQVPASMQVPPQSNATGPAPGMEAQEQITSEGEQQMIMLKMQLATLVRKASQGSDPALYADFILDNVSVENIRSFILRADCIEYLTSINPDVANFTPWFLSLKKELETALSEETSTDDETPDLTNQGSIDNTSQENTEEIEKPDLSIIEGGDVAVKPGDTPTGEINGDASRDT